MIPQIPKNHAALCEPAPGGCGKADGTGLGSTITRVSDFTGTGNWAVGGFGGSLRGGGTDGGAMGVVLGGGVTRSSGTEISEISALNPSNP